MTYKHFFYKAKKSMRIQHPIFIGLVAAILAGCGTSDYDLRAYTQSDGLVGVHTIKKAKESETQAVAEAECKKKGKRRAVFVESRTTVNDRFPITNLYMCRD
jgi:DNA-directed RNA polymerase subunit M/transcription elongation factor TFIIS